MAEETITFELIRKIQVEEQKSSSLTKLPVNFSNAVSNYLEQKRQLATSDDRKATLEIKNIETLIEDIFNRRERKILNATLVSARTGLPPNNLMEEERQFYNSVLGLIKNRRTGLLKDMLSNKTEEQPMVVFKEDTPEFVGIDERTYGPFRKGEIGRIPQDNMQVLLERGIVEISK